MKFALNQLAQNLWESTTEFFNSLINSDEALVLILLQVTHCRNGLQKIE